MKKVRDLIGQLFQERIFCGLDIGSQKIKASLCKVQDADNFELLGVYEVDTRGFKDASVNDIGAFSGAISEALDGLVKKTRIKFQDVYLGVGGELVETRMSRAVIPLTERGNKVIAPSDVAHSRQQARLLGMRLEEEVVEDFVRQFKVDDINVALNPVGLYGRKLEVEVLLVLINNTRLRNIQKAVKQAGYEVNNIFFNGAALSEASVDQKRRQEGCVLVDVGARKTEIFIFKDGLLKHFAFALFGGDRITARLAKELNISFSLAEDIKKSYGRSGDKSRHSSDDIIIKKDQGFVPVKYAAIQGPIDDETAELVKHIRDSIAACGYEGHIRNGVVMAGGGALMPGLMEYVEASLGLPVAMARSIPGLTPALLYAVSTSLAEMGYKGSMRYVFDTRKPSDWRDALVSRFREMCNEYF
ncbi:MAG: cell division protein FtsA [Candidatus Omnitrophica bacterium]|nr:cell division protein FtsA [Candidatus Omnitrophota bacterium]